MSVHESLKGQQALVIRIPQERQDENTEVFGHPTDSKVGQRLALVTWMSRKHLKRRTICAGESLSSSTSVLSS